MESSPYEISEEELKRLLAQVPKTFADTTKAAKMTALIHCQVSTGLAIRDTIQLERDNLRDGTLRIERQKTNKPVVQKLDDGLYQELLKITNGNPKYVFWNGTSLPTSATGLWQADPIWSARFGRPPTLMRAALFDRVHRFYSGMTEPYSRRMR